MKHFFAYSFLIFVALSLSAQETVTMRMRVPYGSTVTISPSHRWLVDDPDIENALQPNANGVVAMTFERDQSASAVRWFRVDKPGHRSVIGCFGISRNSDFAISLPETKKDKSPIDTYEIMEEAGNYLRSNERKRHRLAEKAAKYGNIQAMVSLMNDYYSGKGCMQSMRKYEYWQNLYRRMGGTY